MQDFSFSLTKMALATGMLLALNVPEKGQAAGLDGMIELSITGDPGQQFSGDCYLLQKSGKENRHRIKGTAPTKFWLPAQAVRCNVQKDKAKGDMILTVKRNSENEYVQHSRYPFKWLFIASKGPWGPASGRFFASR